MFDVVMDRQAELDALIHDIWPEEYSVNSPKQHNSSSIGTRSDVMALIQKMFASKYGAQIKALFDGDQSGCGSHSEADLKLMNHAAFWFDRDAQAMDTLMRQSGLFSEKWERDDYRRNTIEKAISGCIKTYQDGLRERIQKRQPQTIVHSDDRPTIRWDESRIHIIIEQVQDILIKRWEEDKKPILFRKPEGIVRVGKVDSASRAASLGVKRDADGPMIYPVDPAWLHAYLTKVIAWQKFNQKSCWIPTSCPKAVVELFLAKRGELRIPFLAGIVNSPTIRADGSILAEPGFDLQTGLFFDPGGIEWPNIPDKPSAQDARKASDMLIQLHAEVPFKSEVDRAVAFAYILTCQVRRSLPKAPGVAFSANTPGSGKTYTANTGSLITTGYCADLMVPPEDEAEMKKVLTSLLLEGANIIVIDNVMRTFFSETLCAVLSAETFKGRILGQTRTPTISTNATFAITGNNLVLRGDTVRRFLLCELDAQMEHPENREFNCDLQEHIAHHRPEIVAAILTLLRAHHIADNKPKLSAFAGFEHWSCMVRSAVVWVGLPDPVLSRNRLKDDDPEREGLSLVFSAWRAVFGDKPANIKDALDPGIGGQELAEALNCAVHTRGQHLSTKDVGYWLRRHKDRIVNGLQLRKIETNSRTKNAAMWHVLSI